MNNIDPSLSNLSNFNPHKTKQPTESKEGGLEKLVKLEIPDNLPKISVDRIISTIEDEELNKTS